MNEQEFDNLVKETRLKSKSREAARLVYVEGMSQSDAGAATGLSPVRMSQIMAVVKKAEADRSQDGSLFSSAPAPSSSVDAIKASYAFAVKAARELYGDDVAIRAPGPTDKFVGTVVERTDFHLVQNLGRGAVAVHELASLDRVPARGKSVAIQYKGGAGQVQERDQAQTRDSNTR